MMAQERQQHRDATDAATSRYQDPRSTPTSVELRQEYNDVTGRRKSYQLNLPTMNECGILALKERSHVEED